jgi:nucleotide-binding universal stress UspA family protein
MTGTTVDRLVADPGASAEVDTLTRTLLAVDGSAASDSALRVVAALLRRVDADVFVVHLTTGGLFTPSFGSGSEAMRSSGSAAEALLNNAVRTLQSRGVRVTGAACRPVEDVGGEIIDSARSLRCGLIALGTGGRGRLGSILLGTVARQVIHRADRSVLVAPLSCTVPTEVQRILVAVDGSQYSQRAVEVAAETAELTGASVVVLHVCHPQGPRWLRHDGIARAPGLQASETAASLVDRLASEIGARGLVALPAVRPAGNHLTLGGLARDVLEAAAEYQCQMVVVGPRGRAGRETMLGSVAFQLLHSATVPVLIAR